jgi:pimeloyl-ACP methyl ester carboxylesterase
MGLSMHPDSGYTKKNQAVDIAGVMDALKVQKADLVRHDIGSFGAAMTDDLRFVASDLAGGIVPSSGHWIMEENPQATVKLVMEFLGK